MFLNVILGGNAHNSLSFPPPSYIEELNPLDHVLVVGVSAKLPEGWRLLSLRLNVPSLCFCSHVGSSLGIRAHGSETLGGCSALWAPVASSCHWVAMENLMTSVP